MNAVTGNKGPRRCARPRAPPSLRASGIGPPGAKRTMGRVEFFLGGGYQLTLGGIFLVFWGYPLKNGCLIY